MPADCRKICHRIPQYVAGEILGEECPGLEDHFEKCEECGAVLKQYRKMVDEGKSLESAVGFETVWREISANINERKVLRPRLVDLVRNHMVPALPVLICVVLVLAALLTRATRVPPAMSVAEMEEVLIRGGETQAKAGKSFQSNVGDTYRLLDSSDDPRLFTLAGVTATDEKTYSIELF